MVSGKTLRGAWFFGNYLLSLLQATKSCRRTAKLLTYPSPNQKLNASFSLRETLRGGVGGDLSIDFPSVRYVKRMLGWPFLASHADVLRVSSHAPRDKITSVCEASLFEAISQGVRAIMTYRGRLRPKGVSFLRFQVYRRVVISLVKVYERVGKSVVSVSIKEAQKD